VQQLNNWPPTFIHSSVTPKEERGLTICRKAYGEPISEELVICTLDLIPSRLWNRGGWDVRSLCRAWDDEKCIQNCSDRRP